MVPIGYAGCGASPRRSGGRRDPRPRGLAAASIRRRRRVAHRPAAATRSSTGVVGHGFGRRRCGERLVGRWVGRVGPSAAAGRRDHGAGSGSGSVTTGSLPRLIGRSRFGRLRGCDRHRFIRLGRSGVGRRLGHRLGGGAAPASAASAGGPAGASTAGSGSQSSPATGSSGATSASDGATTAATAIGSASAGRARSSSSPWCTSSADCHPRSLIASSGPSAAGSVRVRRRSAGRRRTPIRSRRPRGSPPARR